MSCCEEGKGVSLRILGCHLRPDYLIVLQTRVIQQRPRILRLTPLLIGIVAEFALARWGVGMRVVRGFAVLMVIAFVVSLPAQEAQSLGEILQWIPLADFRDLVHYDRAAAEKAQAYAAFVEGDFPGSHSYYIDERRLPPGLRGCFTSVTSVLLVDTEGEWEPSLYDDPDLELPEDTKLYVEFQRTYRIDDVIRVWRFPDLDSLIKQAVKRGELAESGERAYGRPVYTLRREPGGAGEGDPGSARFAYATESRELLTAGKLESIKRMAAAGRGLALSLMDDEVIGQFSAVYQDAGQFWSLTNDYSMKKAAMLILLAEGYPEDKIDEFEERMENGVVFSFHTYLLGERIVEKSIYFYGSDEFDKYSRVRGLKSQPSPVTDEVLTAHALMLERKRKCEVIGNTEIVTTVYDDELLESRKRLKEHWEKQKDHPNR